MTALLLHAKQKVAGEVVKHLQIEDRGVSINESYLHATEEGKFRNIQRKTNLSRNFLIIWK